MIDSHCHLTYDYAPKSSADLIREAGAKGVTHLISIGADAESSQAAAALADAHSNVFFTAGIHPHDSIDIKEGDFDQVKSLSKHPKCVAIGEIGLDIHYDHSPLGVQLKNLDRHLELALERELPIVIHSREAEAPLLDRLSDYAKRIRDGRVPGVIHCFTGTVPFGEACLKLGFVVSFSGIVTFKKAEEVQLAAQTFPLDQLLIETDSPYLAPIPYRGKKCEPYMVEETAKKIADLKGLSAEEVVRATRLNTIRAFRLPLQG